MRHRHAKPLLNARCRLRGHGFCPVRPSRGPPRPRPRVHGGARGSRRARGDGCARPGGAAGSAVPRDPGRAARAREERRAVEPVPAGRAFRPGAHQLGVRDAVRADGPERRGADGLQLRRPRHRQHGDPRRARHGCAARALAPAAARRRDPLVLLDDRAGERRVRPHRPDLARRARRRRVGHQRPQVVHVGLQRRRAGDRDGGHRPRRASAQAREHDPGAGGHARVRGRAPGAGHGARRGPRPLGGPLRGLPRARRQPARGARRGLRHRAGPARARDGSTTACAPSGRPSARSS